jgi:MoxR-like ATPase
MVSLILAEALARLDRRLEALVDAEERRAGLLSGDGATGWEGVRNLTRPRAGALFAAGAAGGLAPTAPDLAFARITRALSLPPVAGDLILLLLAPFVEPRYQSIYQLLQDDLQQPLATERLILSALAPSPDRRGEISALLRSGGALRLSGFVVAPGGRHTPLRQPFSLPEEVAAGLLDEPLVGFAGASDVACLTVGAGSEGRAGIAPAPVRILWGGGAGVGRILADLPPGTRALRARLTAAAAPADAAATLAAIWRVALIGDIWPVVDLRALTVEAAAVAAGEAARLCEAFGGRAQLLASRPAAAPVPQVRIETPGWSRRRQDWETAAGSAGTALAADAPGRLASRHRLSPDDIAALLMRLPDGLPSDAVEPALNELAAAARNGVAGQRTPVRTPRLGLDDLVLRPATRAGLDRLVHFIRARDRVEEDQPGRRHLDLGRGPVALFHGRPGTGKTVAAEAVARELGRPFNAVDLSQLVSKFVGETEKHFDDTLVEAERDGAVLFFDEADALFSRRVEKASSGGEQFSNMVLGYILPRIEMHDGPIILATNLMQGIDEAMMRRFRFRTEFPLPDGAERAEIWRRMLGPVPADLAAVGAAHALSGGEIRNAALKAVFLADQRGVALDQALLDEAVRLELFEMGRLARDPANAGVPDDRGAVLQAVARALRDMLEAHLRAVFLKEIHILEGPPTEKTLSAQRPALSIAMYRLAGRRSGAKDGEGLRLGFVLSAWCQRPEEELEILGVVHALLARAPDLSAAGRTVAVKLQESYDFEMVQRFWSSHDQPVKPSLILDVEID